MKLTFHALTRAHDLDRVAGVLYVYRVSRPMFSSERAAPAVLAQAERAFSDDAAILDAQLEGRTWPVGNRISHADLRVAAALPFADAAGLPLAGPVQVKRRHHQLRRMASAVGRPGGVSTALPWT